MRLPVELVRQVLDCVAQDQSTGALEKPRAFLSVSLACRALCKIAQPYLHRTVFLSNTDRSRAFLQAVEAGDDGLFEHTCNVYYGLHDVSAVSFTSRHFRQAREVAWVEMESEEACFGHQYSCAGASGEIWAYHLVSPSVPPWCTLPLVHNSDTLTHITITIWRA